MKKERKRKRKRKETEAKLVPVLKCIEYSEILKLIKLNNAT